MEQRLLYPPHFPPASSRKGTASSHKLSMKQTVTANDSAGASTHLSWEGCQARPGSPDPGPCHVPLWGITSARSPGKAHWGSETTSGSRDRPSGDQRSKGLAQGHIANQRLSWKRGRVLCLTSRTGLELPWRAAWEVGSGGWYGGETEALCQGTVRAELGGEWEGSVRQASSLGRDVDDVDTIWALLQSGSLFSSHLLMRFLVVDLEVVSSLSLGVCKQRVGEQLPGRLWEGLLPWSGSSTR